MVFFKKVKMRIFGILRLMYFGFSSGVLGQKRLKLTFTAQQIKPSDALELNPNPVTHEPLEHPKHTL